MITSRWTSSRKPMQDFLSPLVTGVPGRKYLLHLKLVHKFLRERLDDKGRIKMKGCLKGGSSKKTSATDTEKAKKIIRVKFKCPNCHKLGHRKNSPKCHFNGTKKRQMFDPILLFHTLNIANSFNVVQEKEAKKNTTKGWFPKETPQPTEDVGPSSPPVQDVTEDVGPSLPLVQDVGPSSPPVQDVIEQVVPSSTPPRTKKLFAS
jgi:hypothetical protein